MTASNAPTPPTGPAETHRALICGIAGGSCSGKTTLCSALSERLSPPPCAVLAFDAYYRDLSHLTLRQRAEVNYDHPDSLDITLFLSDLDRLARGQAVEVPGYDFATHTRTGPATTVQPAPVVLVEGILLLTSTDIRRRLDLSVYIDAPEKLRFSRRRARDASERGRSDADISRQWTESVEPMFRARVAAGRELADIVIESSQPFAQSSADMPSGLERVASHINQLLTRRLGQ